jgi:hypothetical protein
MVHTDQNGNPDKTSFSFTLTNTSPPTGMFVNATATNANSSTSQFSECSQIVSNANCVYSVTPTQSATLKVGGDSGAFNVSTTTGCAWIATTGDSWIGITSGTGSGSGTVTFTVQANPNPSSRQGTISVEGAAFGVNQAGSAPPTDFTISIAQATVNLNSADLPLNITVRVIKTHLGGSTAFVTVTPPANSKVVKSKLGTVVDTDASYTIKLRIKHSAPVGSNQLLFTGKDSSGTITITLTVVVQ